MRILKAIYFPDQELGNISRTRFSQNHDFFLNFCNNLLAIIEEPNKTLRRYVVKNDSVHKKADTSSIFSMRE